MEVQDWLGIAYGWVAPPYRSPISDLRRAIKLTRRRLTSLGTALDAAEIAHRLIELPPLCTRTI